MDNKLSIAEMKQVKAGSVSTNTNNMIATTAEGVDTDTVGGPRDEGK